VRANKLERGFANETPSEKVLRRRRHLDLQSMTAPANNFNKGKHLAYDQHEQFLVVARHFCARGRFPAAEYVPIYA
jgi:hypothetical protein